MTPLEELRLVNEEMSGVFTVFHFPENPTKHNLEKTYLLGCEMVLDDAVKYTYSTPVRRCAYYYIKKLRGIRHRLFHTEPIKIIWYDLVLSLAYSDVNSWVRSETVS